LALVGTTGAASARGWALHEMRQAAGDTVPLLLAVSAAAPAIREGGMISVLLPSVRPRLLPHAYASIAAAAGDVAYEVVIVADFGPEDWPHTTWVVRERKGPIDAIAMAVREARGDFYFVFNDESTLEPWALASLYYAALANPGRVLSPHHVPEFHFAYYGKPFAAFPFVHRETVRDLGGLFDPAFVAFYADPDFSLRAHAKSVPVDVITSAVIRHTQQHDDVKSHNWDAYFNNDRATFRTRWDHLGEFCDP
jgi:hypothetical protein